MKLFEIADDHTPLIVLMLEKLLKEKKVVFIVTMSGGYLDVREVYDIKYEGVFSANAHRSIAGTPYTVVAYKAPGYYSWETSENGDGRGNGTLPLAHVEEDTYTIDRLRTVQGRTDYVFGLQKYVKQWREKNEGK